MRSRINVLWAKIGSMNKEGDKRMWSITATGLSLLVGELYKLGIHASSVRQLQNTLKEKDIYPASDFASLCSPEPPDVFFTYNSATNFVDIQEIVWRAFDHAALNLKRKREYADNLDLEPLISKGIKLWVDFVFINQSAREIRQELKALPQLLNTVDVHYVLGTSPLERAWCCYEIALYNQDCVKKDAPLKSLMAPMSTLYHGWDSVLTTETEDKVFIEESIRRSCIDGFDGFGHIMTKANSVATISFIEGADIYTPESIENLAASAEKWYNRL